MTAFDYFLVGWLLLGLLLTVNSVGKPRRPVEPISAAIVTAINLGLIVLLLVARGVIA